MDTQTLLKSLGGQAAVARECGISDSAVSQWVDEDFIPQARRQYLRLAHPGEHWDAYDDLHPQIPRSKRTKPQAAQAGQGA